MINNYVFPSKYIVQEQLFEKDKFFKSDFRYEDLLILKGDKIKNYSELQSMGKDFYAANSESLSKERSPLYDWVISQGGTEDIDTNFGRYRVYGKPERGVYSIGNPNTGVENIGLGGKTGKIRLDVDFFQKGEIIANVNQMRGQILLESNPRRVPGGWEHDFIVFEEGVWLRPELFSANEEWVKVLGSPTSYVNPGTSGGFHGGFGYSYLEMEVPMTTLSKQYSVDRETHMRQGNLMINRCDATNKILEQNVTNLLEIEFQNSIDHEVEMWLTWGSLTKHHVDKNSGKKITTSPGLFAYLEEGNVFKYNPFVNSIDQIVDIIKSFWYDRVSVSSRKLMLYTGEAGLELWHNWIEQKYGKTAVITQSDFTLSKTAAFDANKQGYAINNYQFTTYKVHPFGEVSVALMPALDNTVTSPKRMKNSMYTVRSFEFIAMDYGMGNPNMKILTNNSRSNRAIVPGFWAPNGHVNQDNPIWKTPVPSLEYTYQVHIVKTFGLAIENLNRILRFIPSVS